MGLLDLPPEIVDEIISLTLPHGIEAFVVCCKAIYGRSASQIQRHNALIRQRRYASSPGTDRDKAFRILYEVSCDPLVAQYIESLDLSTSPGDTSDLDCPDVDEYRTDEEAMHNVEKLVTESDFLQKTGIDVDDWWNKMMAEDEDAEDEEDQGIPHTIVSLLSELPNLRFLQLPASCRWIGDPENDSSGGDTSLRYVLDALVEQSNKATGSETPLGRLEVLLPYRCAGYEERAGLRDIGPFLALKSIRELYSVSLIAVDDHYTGIPFEWRSPALTSPLTRVELAHCCMDADGISHLLTHTPLLQVFRYSHETKWHGCQHDWNPGAFCEALSRHCGKTIIALAITIDELYGEIVNGASTFQGFPNLQHLEADVTVFCGPPIESGQWRGEDPHVPEGETPWTEHDIPCIGTLLPDSIVTVDINTDFPHPDKDALRSLLKNVKEQRAERLRKLDPLTIRQYTAASAQEMVEEASVTLETFDLEAVPARPRSMMPAWKRAFIARVGGIQFT